MKLSPEQLDGLKELINIGVGKGAETLNVLLSSHIELQVPFIRILTAAEFASETAGMAHEQLAAVDLGFRGDFCGTTQLIFPAAAASKLVSALTGEDAPAEDLDAIRSGTLCEIGNIVLNGLLGSISNVFNFHLTYTVPGYQEGRIEDVLVIAEGDDNPTLLLARTRFSVAELEIDGELAVFFEVGGLDSLLRKLDELTEQYRE